MKDSKLFLILFFALFIIFFLGTLISAFSLDEAPSKSVLSITNFFKLGETWKEIIIGLVFSAIIFAVIFDILRFFSFKNSSIKIIICIAAVFIAAYFSLTQKIILLLISFVAGFGTIGTIGLIVISIIIFIGLSFASLPLAKLAAKLKRY